jgi:hypothetical protein
MIWFNKFLESQGCKGAVSSRHECKAVRDDALIWVGEIGVNDYAYIVGSSVSSDTIRKLAINHLHHRIPIGNNRALMLLHGNNSILINKQEQYCC